MSSKDRKIIENDGFVGFYGCEYSNFYKSSFILNGITFNCSEQAFMYCKAMLFNDQEMADKILNSSNPVECKRLGRKVKNFNGDVWNEKKEGYMKSILYSKFINNPKLKEMLLSTGDKIIVECSPYDNEWGCGLGVDDFFNQNCNMNGHNKLGFALMAVREKLKEG